MILYPNIPMRGLAQEIVEAFRAEAVALRVEQEVEDVLTAVALVASGFGLAITTQSATSLRLPGVAFRPLASRHLRSVELSCLYRRGDASLRRLESTARARRPRSTARVWRPRRMQAQTTSRGASASRSANS